MIGPKPFRIRFDKTGGFIRIYDGTTYLTLFRSKNYDAIYGRSRYPISLSITYIFSHHFAKIKNYDSLTMAKRLTLRNVIILIKWVLNKDKNHYYYTIFLEKCSMMIDI